MASPRVQEARLVSPDLRAVMVPVDRRQRMGESRRGLQRVGRWPLVFPLRNKTNVHFCTFVRNDSQPRA